MPNFSLLSRFGYGQFIKPVFIFSVMVLTISTIFTTLILTGTTATGLRKFYLISLRYSTDSKSSKVMTEISGLLSSNKGKVAFDNIRVGYRGICIEHSGGWNCARNGAALGHAAGDISGDPLDLVAIADLYRDKISFAFPVWIAVISLGVAWICVAMNCVPGIPIPGWTKKVAAGGCGLGSLALLGAMCLQQVTSGAVSTLVDKMGMDAVDIHIGTADIGFGWSAFGLAMLATIGVSAIVIADWGVAAAQAKALAKGEEALEKASGGRLQMNDFARDVDVENPPTKPNGTHPSLGTSSIRGAIMDKGVELGKKHAKVALQRTMRK